MSETVTVSAPTTESAPITTPETTSQTETLPDTTSETSSTETGGDPGAEVSTTETSSDIRQRYDAILAKCEKDPNVRLSDAELDLISDIQRGRVKLDEPEAGETDPNNPEGAETAAPDEMDELDKEITTTMNELGVEKFEDLPKKIKEVFGQQAQQIQERDTQIAQYKQNESQVNPIFENMEKLLIGLYNGDQTVKAQVQSILQQRGIDPGTFQGQNAPQTKSSGDINPEDFLDPAAYKAVTGKIDRLESSVNEFLRAKQAEALAQKEVAAQTTARNEVTGEFVSLVTKYPSFGLKPHQVQEGIESYFKTGIVPTSMKPLFELVSFTDKFNTDNGYNMKLEHAYKIREADTMGQKIADEVKKAKTSLVKQKPTTGLATAQNRSSQGIGGTVHGPAALQKMVETGDYPDAWKTGISIDQSKIPKADYEVLQQLWARR